jgi:predicted Rossmann-fold nucleotide-binding protein
MNPTNADQEREIDEFIRPSPSPPSKRTIERLDGVGNRNNIIAYKILQEIHALYAQPEIWKGLSNQTRMELTALRGIGFDGCYPDQNDIKRIRDGLGEETGSTKRLLETLDSIESFIQVQEGLWSSMGSMYPSEDLQHILQDTIVAVHELPEIHGRRIVTFGSARTPTSSPVYDAVRWLNETIVTGSLREDGTSETVLSGAGPGTMEAANLGAMKARWNILQALNGKALSVGSEEQETVQAAIVTARSQIHSMGIRIQLPFEAFWNDHLQLNLTIKNFAPRKGALISTAMGHTIKHKKDENNGHPNHPAIFAMPGGFGTEDELWDAACLIQCGKMPGMPIFAMGEKMGEKMMHDLDQMQSWGAISPDDWDIFTICKDEVDAVEQYHEAHGVEMSQYTKDQVTHREPTINM